MMAQAAGQTIARAACWSLVIVTKELRMQFIDYFHEESKLQTFKTKLMKLHSW
ncbi:MAG: hypothetical protein ACTS42_01260 [Candidatus Hodgkinia cicadicola]